ncbi:DUF192 domain-containing protein [Flagellatimonas centrodinii]|uniref:DUF192 domain-containing protein n=1 Tax=Flagellatimonas centrodinii TaxID=2806210 RepID=UPI0034507F0D
MYSAIQIVDADGRLLFARCHQPKSFWARARGLLGRRALRADEAWWFTDCRGVHSVGLSLPIDVVHLDAHGRIVALCTPLHPARISWQPRGCHVVEMAAGRARALGLQAGQLLARRPCAP